MSAQAKEPAVSTTRTDRPGRSAGRARSGSAPSWRASGLWDLVQMECLARSRLVVLVTGEGGVGYLYFDHGQHRSRRHRRSHGRGGGAGDPRAGPTARSSPATAPGRRSRTIATSHEALILQVAKRRDEGVEPGRVSRARRRRRRSRTSRCSRSRRKERRSCAAQRTRRATAPPARGIVSDRTLRLDPPPPAHAERARDRSRGDFSVMLRLGAHGAIIKNSGGREELAETVAYVRRLTELAGELLGLEGFTGVRVHLHAGPLPRLRGEQRRHRRCCGRARRRTCRRCARGWGCDRRRRDARWPSRCAPAWRRSRTSPGSWAASSARPTAGWWRGRSRRCSTTARSPRRAAACCGCARRSPPGATSWRSA